MAGWQLNQFIKGKLVEHNSDRLQLLRDDENNLPTSSPSWKALQNGPSRVKVLSKLFEDQSKQFSAKTNWWLDESTSSQSPGSPKPRTSLSRVNSSSPLKSATKLERILHELIQKEVTYIQALENGIANYVSTINAGNHNVPADLRLQVFRLFGNIEHIYDLHKNSVYPRLMICNGNPRLIAETISSFIQNDLFYCYIVYAINQKSAEQLVLCHQQYFETLRSTTDDLLGVNSFLIQPIQKLPRYKMFFDELIKELSRDLSTNKDAAAACCVAEKNVKRLLIRLNEALSINEIIETHEFGASVQMALMTTIQNDFGVNINEPLMLLVPKSSSNFQFRSPFNVYDLGKFIKTAVLRASEYLTGRSFMSKVFIFEKCLLYTKIINESTLGYRTHFAFNAGFAFITDGSQVSFRVSGVKKKHDVDFSSDNIESIVEMKKLINQFYDPRRSADSAFVDGHELMITENEELTDDEDWVVTDDEEMNQKDETLCIANSRFFVKSPNPEDKENFPM